MTTATNTMGRPETLLNAYALWGTDVQGLSTEAAMKATGLWGWNQHLVTPMLMDENGEYPPGTNRYNVATIPGLGNTVLGPVTSRYKVHQLEEAFLPMNDTLDGLGYEPVTMGAHSKGRAAFALYKAPDGLIAPGGDPVENYLIVTKRNDGSGSIVAAPTPIRVQCGNEVSRAIRTARQRFAVRHSGAADANVVAMAEVAAGMLGGWDKALKEEIENLQKVKVSKRTFTQRIAPAALGGKRPDEAGRSQAAWDRKFDELVATWDSPYNADGATAWKALNTVTEWEQHHRSDDTAVMALSVVLDKQPFADRAAKAIAAL